MLTADELAELRLHLVAFAAPTRRDALSRALRLDQPDRHRLMVACDITGQGVVSDEVVELLSAEWREWPTLTRLCLRSCWLLGAKGCAVIAAQGRFLDLELAGCSILDDACLAQLATLPLNRLELWDAEKVGAVGARSLAQMPTLRRLAWNNAPGDAAVTTALAGSRTLVELDYTCKGSTAALIAPLAEIPRLERMTVFDVDDDALVALARARRLTDLEIQHSPRAGDVGIVAICGLPDLSRLALHECAITDAGMARIAGVPGLESLELIGTALVGDEGLVEIGSARSLARLRLMRLPSITTRGLASLRPPILVSAELAGCAGIGDDTGAILGRHHRLEQLDLSGTAIGDRGVRDLAPLGMLWRLELARTAITDESLHQVASMTGLRLLDVSGCDGVRSIPAGAFGMLTALTHLRLPRTAPLTATAVQRLVAACPQLRCLRLGLAGTGGATALTRLQDLRDLWITGAEALEDAEYASLARPPLREIAVHDAPWLGDQAFAPFEAIESLRCVGVFGCPGISTEQIRRLVRRRHLQAHARMGLASCRHFMILRGQFITDVVGTVHLGDGPSRAMGDATQITAWLARADDPRTFLSRLWSSVGADADPAIVAELVRRALGERRDDATLGAVDALVGSRHPAAIAVLAALAVEPSAPPQPMPDRHLVPDHEILHQAAVRMLGECPDPAAVPPLAQALGMEPTRWAWAGWSLVRLASAGVVEATTALRLAAEDQSRPLVAQRARRFIGYVSGGA